MLTSVVGRESDKRGRIDIRVVRMEEEMDKVTIRLPRRYIRRLDFLVRVDDFPSRSEAIRTAVRDLLYERIELVLERQKRWLELDIKDAEIESLEKKYLQP